MNGGEKSQERLEYHILGKRAAQEWEMPETDLQLQSFPIGKITDIDEILSNFYLATGIPAVVLEREGILSLSQPAIFGGCCQFIAGCEQGPQKRGRDCGYVSTHAAMVDQPVIFKCQAGLGGFAIPLRDGASSRSVICGPIHLWEPNQVLDDEVGPAAGPQNMAGHHFHNDANLLRVMSPDETKAAANLLSSLIHTSGMSPVDQAARQKVNQDDSIAAPEARMSETNLRALIERHKHDDFFYRYQALICAIKIGDQDEAMRLLIQALDNTAEKYSNSPHGFKTRVIEFAFKISREVAEFGVNLDELTTIDSQFLEEVFEITDGARLRWCMAQVVKSYTDLIGDKTMAYKYEYIVQYATEFIKSNFEKELTIEQVANAIHVSQYYLSHIFKGTMNCSIRQYMIRIKMGKAQSLLLNLNLSMDEICSMVGYKNNRHFVETFKKIQGVTPHQYRTKLINALNKE